MHRAGLPPAPCSLVPRGLRDPMQNESLVPLSSHAAASTPGTARKRRGCFPSSIKVGKGEADGVTERGPVFMMVDVTYIDLQALCSFASSLLSVLFLAL